MSGCARLSWLREVYEETCVHGRWDCAVRAFLLHLVGNIIFVDKSVTSISVSYLGLFEDLSMCGGYSWGSVALTHMREYMSIFQSRRDLNLYYDETQPRAARYVLGRNISTLSIVRERIDALTDAGIN